MRQGRSIEKTTAIHHIAPRNIDQLSAMQKELYEAVQVANGPLLTRIAHLEQMLVSALDKPEETFLTVEQAAKIIKLHPKTVRKYCHSGQIEFRRDGRKILISKRALTEIAA